MRQTLISFLNRKDIFEPVGSHAEETFKAAMALKAMGEEARALGAGALLEQIEKSADRSIDWDAKFKQLIALAWLGNSQDFEWARKFVNANNAPDNIRSFAAVLRPVSDIADEGAFWIDLIGKQSPYPANGGNWTPNYSYLLNNQPEWFLVRLAYLRESRSIPVLFNLLKEKHDWWIRPICQALAQIGEPAITELKSVISKEEDLSVYRDSFYILCDSQKEKLIPFVRQLVKDRPANLPEIWFCFSRYGTADDIALLSPLNNYWKFGGNPFLQDALISMREKFGYDLNGPIKKNSR